jgi:hypothetical protein
MMGFFRSRSRKEPESISSGDERKELSLNLSDLQFISILKLSEEVKKRVSDAREMLKKKALEICGTAPGTDEFKDIVRMQTLVSSDPKPGKADLQMCLRAQCRYELYQKRDRGDDRIFKIDLRFMGRWCKKQVIKCNKKVIFFWF